MNKNAGRASIGPVRISDETSLHGTFSSARRRVFMIATVLTPLVFLGIVEIALRVGGYGRSLSVFSQITLHGKQYYLFNHQVKGRYFPGFHFAQTAALDYFVVPKPPRTFRIFILGESTAVGYPYPPNASFPSFLQHRLERLFPDRTIEVINLAMTATDSYTVLDLAEELPRYQPDLLVVYDGHNEFYGGLGSRSLGILGDSRIVRLAYLQMLHSRVFIAMRDGFERLRSLIYPARQTYSRDVTGEFFSQGQRVPYGSSVYWESERSFRANLDDLRALCRRYNIPLLLGTQVSNLRGQPPFVSNFAAPVTAEQKALFTQHQEKGRKAWDERRWNDALRDYRAAESIDTLYAGVHFAIARCLDVLGKKDEARMEYVKARDDDELRFRASSDFNRAILAMEDGHGTGVVDIEGLFMRYSPDSLIGNELILDHLHPNSWGYFLMAKAYAEAMRKDTLLVSPDEWARRDTIDDRELWNERNVTVLDERIAIERTAILTSTWPFHERSLSVPATLPHDTLEVLADHVVEGSWGAANAHQVAAAYYESSGDPENAEREEEVVVALDPQNLGTYLDLANLYIAGKQWHHARTILQTSLSIESTEPANKLMGDIDSQLGDHTGAIAAYERATSLSTTPEEYATNSYLLALAYLREDNVEMAKSVLRRLLLEDPQYKAAADLLVSLNAQPHARENSPWAPSTLAR